MSKQRRTVSLDRVVDDYLAREGVNASELVNKLVKQHMNGGATDDEIREFRIKQLESEYEDLASRTRRKLEELNEIRDRVEETQNRQEREIDEFIEEMVELGATPPEDHHRVGALADKWFDGDTDEAVTAIRDRARERDDVARRILQ